MKVPGPCRVPVWAVGREQTTLGASTEAPSQKKHEKKSYILGICCMIN